MLTKLDINTLYPIIGDSVLPLPRETNFANRLSSYSKLILLRSVFYVHQNSGRIG